MRPHDRRAERVALRALVALAAFGSPLHAHSLLRTSGQALIDSNRVVVTLDVCAEDFAHLYGLLPAADGTVTMDSILAMAKRHADDLTAALQLWDESGAPLAGEPFRLSPRQPGPPAIPWTQLRPMRLRFTASYLLPTHCSFLTFRMSAPEQTSAIARQWVVEVRAGDDTARQVIQLTSRGNAETVELQWIDDRPRLRPRPSVANEAMACASFKDRGAPRFHEIFVDLDLTPKAISVRTSMPLPLLETWIPVRRKLEGGLDTKEQSALLIASRALMSTAMAVESDGQRLTPDSLEFRVLGPGTPSGEGSVPPEPIGFFTARLEVLQRLTTPDPSERLTVHWTLLNSAVLSTRVAIHVDDQCTAREFTSYAPTLEWQRTNTAALGLP